MCAKAFALVCAVTSVSENFNIIIKFNRFADIDVPTKMYAPRLRYQIQLIYLSYSGQNCYGEWDWRMTIITISRGREGECSRQPDQ